MSKLAVWLLIALCADAARGAITLADKGKSPYSIVVDANASPSEQRAARELQRFLEEMSGARLPLASAGEIVRGPKVFVGDSPALRKLRLNLPLGELGPEGFILRAHGRHLVIAGGRQRGTMYGVYAFLERLGCRWFTSGVSRIPKTPLIRIDSLNAAEKPAFEYREPFFTEAFDKDWAARNRTNGAHSRLDESTGGKLQYYPFVHTFYQLVPPEKHFKEHPEYFSFIDGKRRVERGQLCLTNPDVLRIASEQVERWIRDHPEATLYSVSQNDWEGWCECGRCLRVEQEEGGKHMGPVLRFVNALAERIEKSHPDKLIDTIAYWYTEEPPAKARPRPNVRIRLAPIGICTAHSFASCPRSAYFAKNLKAWSEITNQLYIWHYNTNFSHYLLPFPDFDELAADIPLYKKHGVAGLFMQGAYEEGGGGEMAWLRSYVLARLLWNPSVNVNEVIDEFFQGVYGGAARRMRMYFDLLHHEVRPRPAGLGAHLWIFNVPDYSEALLTTGMQLLRQAETEAGSEAVARAVRKDRLSLEYLALLRAREYRVDGGFYSPAGLAGLKKQAAEFLRQVREFGIERLHEGQDLKLEDAYWEGLQSHPVHTLENAVWRADIVPGLNGRVVRLIEKPSGRDLLRRPPPGDLGYPALGGIMAGFYPDQHGRAWDVNWTVESASAEEVRLGAQAPGGLRLRRIYSLEAGGLQTRTVVENTGQDAQPVAIQVRADLDPVDIDTATVEFRTPSGATVERRLIVEGEPPAGREMWEKEKLPAGEWRLSSGAVNRFSGAQRALLTWSVKSRPGVTLALWSPESRLAPGGMLVLDAAYGRAAAAQKAALVYARSGNGVFGYKDTPKQPWSEYLVHDPDRPEPARVTTAHVASPSPPSDAITLFDGKDLSRFLPSKWKVENGYVEVTEGDLVTRGEFGDCQLHVEWRAPAPPVGGQMNRGNSGIHFMGLFEVQVFDSATVKIYADGQAASIYGQTPPLVNASKAPGEWQSYDIVFIAPRWADRKLKANPRVTVFHNGVLVQHDQEIYGTTLHRRLPGEIPAGLTKAPLKFSGHHNPVRYRNIWIRPL
jgi:hypothetical protein